MYYIKFQTKALDNAQMPISRDSHSTSSLIPTQLYVATSKCDSMLLPSALCADRVASICTLRVNCLELIQVYAACSFHRVVLRTLALQHTNTAAQRLLCINRIPICRENER
jgi:hypothetical protein